MDNCSILTGLSQVHNHRYSVELYQIGDRMVIPTFLGLHFDLLTLQGQPDPDAAYSIISRK
jgi:hypothetical protein